MNFRSGAHKVGRGLMKSRHSREVSMATLQATSQQALLHCSKFSENIPTEPYIHVYLAEAMNH